MTKQTVERKLRIEGWTEDVNDVVQCQLRISTKPLLARTVSESLCNRLFKIVVYRTTC